MENKNATKYKASGESFAWVKVGAGLKGTLRKDEDAALIARARGGN